ncbi:allene oxide synthase-lipoxygenase protein-like [Babylonia areolata]|uniref:allene oxide synthase-lipoxygenase protein-like n=1 Tax=Babylonia areolata TaxID=304850 RepID=UPI003FD3B273
MGNCCQGPPSEYTVYIRTGDRKNAGTDANVRIVLHDDKGHRSDQIVLDNFLRNDFERGALDQFEVPKNKLNAVERLGKIVKIEFWRDDSGLGSDWYVDKVVVENKSTNAMYVFPVFRWVRPDWHYFIKHLDTSLPQFEEYREQRDKELDEKRRTYVFSQKAPGMPAQIKSMPPDEQFSNEYKWDIVKTKIQLIATSKLVMLTSGDWQGLSDLRNVYTENVFNIPKGADRWSNDLYFGLQRINSLNHSLIELLTEIPEKFPVTDEILEPLLEGLTIQQALDQKRLFICDLKIMEGLPVRPNFVLCSPMAMLFLDSEEKLMPIAIQLFQDPGPDNPVDLLPTDHSLTWALVKMWYNNADAAYHQSLTHLGFTHLLMEGVVVSTHRQLSQSHPIFKLLAPHFLFLIAINSRGLELLVSENGWVDKTMNFGLKGMFELIRRGINSWRLDVEGTLPNDLKKRKLDDPKVLPCYHFRHDALMHYEAINKYVKAYVALYYDTQDKLTEDVEIQAWATELAKARDNEKGGVGILGIPGEGHLTSNEQLVSILTTIIYTCSVSHASTNFPQYEEYGFPPNYPGLLRGQPPRTKAECTEEDIIKALPDRPTTLDIMIVTKILSQRGTKSIGDFEVQYIFDDRAREIVDEFRRDLAKISKKIKERNSRLTIPYEYLDPDIVPNSISI